MICWSCQTDNPDPAEFCSSCGSKLQAEMGVEGPCRSCGAPLPLEARFCGYCGTPDPIDAPSAEVTELAKPSEQLARAIAETGRAEATAQAFDEAEDEPFTGLDDVDDDFEPEIQDDEEEATILRGGLDGVDAEDEEGDVVVVETPVAPPGPVPRPKLATEPARVATARTLQQRMSPGGASPGAYSKQGPSLRARKADGGKPSLPPPPPSTGRKPGSALPGPPAGPPAVRPARPGEGAGRPFAKGRAGPPPAPSSAKTPPRKAPLPKAPPRKAPLPKAPPRKAPSPVASKTEAAPVSARSDLRGGTEPAEVAEPTPSVPGPGGLAKASPSARPRTPRTLTEPQKAVYASPRPDEAAQILAPPDGWPDITDELAEIRFSAIQGFDDDTRRAISDLRARYPGHPEVDILAEELGEATSSRPSLVEEDKPTPVAGPPPRGRFQVTPKAEPEVVPPPGLEPAITGRTLPPSPSESAITGRISSPSSTAPAEAAEPELRLPSNLVSRPERGAPEPTPLETSDELLELDAAEFESLADDDEDEGPLGSSTAVPEPEPVDSSAPVGELRGGTEPSPTAPLSSEPPGPALDAGESFGDLDLDFDDDDDEVEELDAADRTMMVRGYQPPAPYAGGQPPELVDPVAVPGNRATLVPTTTDADERSPTLAPLGEFDPRGPDELETTLPPGAMALSPEERAALDAAVPSSVDEAVVPPEPEGIDLEDVEPYAPSGMTAPDRDAESAAASGEFRVSDLGLDDLPDLEESSASVPPIEPAPSSPGPVASPEPTSDPSSITADGTVIARNPLPPSPYGAGRAPDPLKPVRLVMLGARGDVVAVRRIEAGTHLDIGRTPGEPWAGDRRMEPLHARLFPAPGGIVIDDFGAPQGVYTQISDTIAVEDGDEFKVGQARLALQRVVGPGGVWGQLTLVRHDDPTPATYRLDRDEILVGRDEGDITLPNDTFVSGDHCRFGREGNAVYLEDLGSSNGTYIRVRAGQCVAFGGLLLIGHTQFRVEPA